MMVSAANEVRPGLKVPNSVEVLDRALDTAAYVHRRGLA